MTGQTTFYVAASVDGYIAAEDGGVGWLEEFDDGDSGYEAFVETVDCLAMGARTYDQIRAFGAWPYGDRPTYVFSSSERPRAAETVQFVSDDAATVAARLRQRHDHVWLVGGGTLAGSFLRTDAIDGLRLTVVPVVLGSGVRLFGEGGVRRRLDLRDATERARGLVELRHEVRGGWSSA
jgi:dihydrofolate reductase